ncbi:MAG TPA: methyltransferase domain-containing protein [Gemmatimonadales bacterium]|nr:methyltransferase domain-containing protein [Gemmatimonadales bacterium]
MNREAMLSAPPSVLLDRLACPGCGAGLVAIAAGVECPACGSRFAETEGVLDFRLPAAARKPEFADWTEHWSGAKQQSIPQRFFSLYRRAVFARTVAWFIERYFPAEGVLVEAGSGTAETSMRISKRGGRRLLVAVDLVLPVVARCHPVMDVRLAADIFRLPFSTGSIDGIWNVGVMEHFTHDLIDEMLLEFRRVLRPGAPLLLLWPATDSLPQKALRAVEAVVHLRRESREFRFHPDEISQLRSAEEGRHVLRRTGFEPLTVDPGWRSLFAFKTLVGRRPAA